MLQIQRMRTIGYRNRMVGIAGFLRSIPTAPVGANYGLLSHPAYWASDASHLISCAAGDAIRWWKDAVTGLWYEQPTSGLRYIARQDATGKWYAENDGTKTHPWANLSAIQRANGAFAAAYRLYSSVSFAFLIHNGTDGGAAVRQLRQETSLRTAIMINNNGSTLSDPVSNLLNTDYRHIGVFSGFTTLYRNGTLVASGTDSSSGNGGPNTYIGGASNSNFMNGRMYGCLIATSNAISVSTWDAALQGYCTA